MDRSGGVRWSIADTSLEMFIEIEYHGKFFKIYVKQKTVSHLCGVFDDRW